MMYKRVAILLLLDKMFLKLSPKFSYLNNINSWPLFKIQIGYNLIFEGQDKVKQNSKETSLSLIKIDIKLSDIYKLIRGFYKSKILALKFSNKFKNQVFLFGFKEHYYKEGGKQVNLYLTPFKVELKKKRVEYCELLISNNSTSIERNELNYLFEYILVYNRKLFAFKNVFNAFNSKAYKNSLLVKEFLDENNIESSSYLANVVYRAQMEQEIKFNTFKQFFKIVSPKLIWTYCYYDNSVMALIRAANELSIPIIEYQHSVQSDEHNAYSKWSGSNLYKSFFPKYFWVWEDADKERIIRNFSDTNYTPNVIVGGNLSSIQQKKKFKYNVASEKGILVSLQGNWIPKFVEEAIEKDDKHTWYFRLHPRYPTDIEKLNEFKSKFPNKIEVEKANQLSIYKIFSLVKINITDFSGVALESFEFGVKNIIIGDIGKQTFSDFIQKNKFLYVQEANVLLHIINNTSRSQEVFKSNGDKLDSIFEKIVKGNMVYA